MAAAARSGSRGGAGGLFFLFTLLCLVCLASSRFDDDNLKNLKGNVQKLENEIAHLRDQRDTLSRFMRAYESQATTMFALLDTLVEESAADSLPLKGILENSKSIMRYAKALIDGENENWDAKIADMELKLENVKKYIKISEEYLTEL